MDSLKHQFIDNSVEPTTVTPSMIDIQNILEYDSDNTSSTHSFNKSYSNCTTSQSPNEKDATSKDVIDYNQVFNDYSPIRINSRQLKASISSVMSAGPSITTVHLDKSNETFSSPINYEVKNEPEHGHQSARSHSPTGDIANGAAAPSIRPIHMNAESKESYISPTNFEERNVVEMNEILGSVSSYYPQTRFKLDELIEIYKENALLTKRSILMGIRLKELKLLEAGIDPNSISI